MGAHEVAPEILMPEGPLGAKRPSARDEADIARGIEVLRATGSFDIGQAVVVAGNHVLALEAAEGTDQMLERIVELQEERPYPHRRRRRRSGEGAETRPGPAVRSAVDRAAHDRRRRSGGPCRARGARRRHDCRRAASASWKSPTGRAFSSSAFGGGATS